MGGGSYGYAERMYINSQQYKPSVSREEVFKQSKMHEDMDIKGKVRECRFSEEHPDAFPIIIALDVTGSMGHVPDKLIRTGLPDIMKKILESGVKDPQVCFVAIGDQYTDSAPIQVGQFESSDELLDKWLKTVWLEGHGGGNGGESYQLAWQFADHHTDCDWINVRGKKGVLISIGDDAVHKSISSEEIKRLFGKKLQSVTTSGLLSNIQSCWDVYHITLNDYNGKDKNVQKQWNDLLGDHHTVTEDRDGNDIPKIISGMILESYNRQKSSGETTKTVETEHNEHLL